MNRLYILGLSSYKTLEVFTSHEAARRIDAATIQGHDVLRNNQIGWDPVFPVLTGMDKELPGWKNTQSVDDRFWKRLGHVAARYSGFAPKDG